MRVHSKRIHRKLSVKKNKTNRKRQQRNKRSTKSRVRGGGPWDMFNSLGGPGKYNEARVVPRYSIDSYSGSILINEGFEYHVDQSGYGGYDTTMAVKLEPTQNSQNIYIANPAIYVHKPSLQDPSKKPIIENDIRNALWEYSRVQMGTQNSHVEIHGDETQGYTLQVY